MANDVRGKLILNKSNNLQQTIDLSTRENGIYFITIYNGESVENKKLIKK